jgi:hypothetical protein
MNEAELIPSSTSSDPTVFAMGYLKFSAGACQLNARFLPGWLRGQE